MTRVLAGLLAAALASCGQPPPAAAPVSTADPKPPPPSAQPNMPTAERHWTVFDGDTLILEVSDRPGPILSTATLPPGQPPLTSPFMSATSRDSGHENQLYNILVAAHDLDGFLGGLRSAGFDVRVAP